MRALQLCGEESMRRRPTGGECGESPGMTGARWPVTQRGNRDLGLEDLPIVKEELPALTGPERALKRMEMKEA